MTEDDGLQKQSIEALEDAVLAPILRQSSQDLKQAYADFIRQLQAQAKQGTVHNLLLVNAKGHVVRHFDQVLRLKPQLEQRRVAEETRALEQHPMAFGLIYRAMQVARLTEQYECCDYAQGLMTEAKHERCWVFPVAQDLFLLLFQDIDWQKKGAHCPQIPWHLLHKATANNEATEVSNSELKTEPPQQILTVPLWRSARQAARSGAG